MITQTINLNLIPGGILPRINVSQYDKGARTLQFNLYNGVTPFTIPDGSSVYVVGTKADKTGFDYEATYTGGLVSIDVTEQMTAFAGDVEIEIRIIKSGEQIATGNFILCVERTALADDTVISETDIPIIQHLPELVAETEENAELAHKWATFGDESEEPSATNNAKYWAEQAEAAQDLTYDTATGNPVSFTTDSSGISKDTIVTLEPIQNLHGYDHPWPAGGGKNLLPMTVADIKSSSWNTDGTWSGNSYTFNGITYTVQEEGEAVVGVSVSGTATANSTMTIAENFEVTQGQILNGSPTGGRLFISNNGGSTDYARDTGSGDTVNASATNVRSYIQVLNGTSISGSLLYKPMLRESNETDPTFAPYSNICPISGYTEIEVNGCGVNVWDEEWESGTIDSTTGQNTPNADRIRSKNYIPVISGEQYYLVGSFAFIPCYDANKNYIGYANLVNNIVTIPNNCQYIRFAAMYSTYNNNISVNHPSTDTSYRAYTGHRITSPLPSTIYGGTYDVETGELTVDRALVDLGTLNWSYSSSPAYHYATLNPVAKAPASNWTVMAQNKSSALKTVAYQSIYNQTADKAIAVNSAGAVWARDTDYTDAATFKTAMSGVQLAYELATPYTIQLEPHLLNLFEGQNNVSTNGTQISVTYRNGIVARVDDFNAVGESFEALTGKVEAVETSKAESSALAPVESGATASQPYAVGDYLYRNGTLYRVTSAIASGATFTVDTNITATTVMAEIVRLTQ